MYLCSFFEVVKKVFYLIIVCVVIVDIGVYVLGMVIGKGFEFILGMCFLN